MSTIALTSKADRALKGAAGFWFLVAIVGQVIFALTVASYYGLAALRGTSQLAWSRFLSKGYVPGDTAGNLAVAVHVSMAAVITLAGVLQLIPQVRNRFPVFHRWNGRVYVVSAFAASLAGLYMVWIRGSVGDLSQHLGSTLNAVLIMLCAVMAMRYAMAYDFTTHRRWALRLFLVVSASWFYRVGLYFSYLVNGGPFGFNPATFQGPFLTFMGFGTYLVPLAVLEIYFRAQKNSASPFRIATAAGLVVLTVAMGVGIFAVGTSIWAPALQAAYDSRTSVAGTVAATIDSSGIEAAAKQYHALKAQPAGYNFDERELNTLGYQLIKAKKFKEAIGVFQLNVDAYPDSSNTYDSLGEAYMNDGDKPQAIANYRKSIELNPNNRNGIETLRKLMASERP